MQRVATLAISLFSAERPRWSLWLPVCFGTGIGVNFLLQNEPAPWTSGAVLAVLAAAGFLLRARTGFLVALWALAAAAAGFSAAQIRTAWVDAPVVQKRLGPGWVSGRVIRVELKTNGRRIWLDQVSVARLPPDRTPERVRIRTRSRAPILHPGDRLGVRAVLYPPPGPAAPGAFNFSRRAYFQRLGSVGYAVGRPRIVAGDGAETFAIALAGLRQHITKPLHRALPGARGGIAAALITGERGRIPEDVLAAMRDSGPAHLLAISGLHIGLIGGIVFFAIRLVLAGFERLTLRHPIKKMAAAIALIAALGYVALSGATVPTQRAFLMLSLVMVAIMLDRLPISMRLVAWAAAAVLISAPENLLSVSFQMSFAAVVALVAVYETGVAGAARWRSKGPPRPVIYLCGVVITTLVAGLATAPFAIYHFNRMALFGVMANLIAIPLAGFWIMPWALAAVLLMPLGLENLALMPMGWGIDGLIGIARFIQELPGAVALLPAMPPAGLVLVALGGLWLCLWQLGWRYAGNAPIAIGLLTITLVRTPDVMVDGAGRLMAVRGVDGRLLLSPSAWNGLKTQIWLRRAGQIEAIRWPRRGSAEGGRITCDGFGCIYRAAGHRVALVREPDALDDDCRRATVVISRVPVRRRACSGPLAVIDRFKLWREGPHSLWLDQGKVRIESVA